MKNFRAAINGELDKLDLKWRALPLKTQCKYVIVFFMLYLLLGIGVLAKVWYDLGKEDQISINHIESTARVNGESLSKDSVLINNKNLRNGRERE
ncbi:nitrogen regulatory IIA protein [Sphingobacterium sp. SRCM116780]|uniref:nitrogen regulatory IIA protein n=1 Tax=Sphingobacterium sp. SRCM116780 TaxID=2907623 RepID=UPI001F249751|nr:nitrogen regulatory IIA protein [Sphingobacterium sp. SRCM116780]UIR57838.1 nitrogen regulatory IIA protein [Sphingobacterium sp. SRCM116780]